MSNYTKQDVQEWLENDNFINEQVSNMLGHLGILGGYGDRLEAIKRALEYDLVEYPTDAGDLIGELLEKQRNDYGVGLDRLDPVSAVCQEAIDRATQDLDKLGLEVEFELYSNYLNSSISIYDSDNLREQIEDKLRDRELSVDVLEELSPTTMKVLEECDFNIHNILQEFKEATESDEETNIAVRKPRKK